MLTELCQELRNWFDRDQPKYQGDYHISDGVLIDVIPKLQAGQYFRIMGSTFNDGVYQYPVYDLRDEDFHGSIWLMAVPKEIETLSEEIDKWQQKYYDIDGQAMSPYSSESFGGYSYTKSSSGSNSGDGGASWQSAFASQLKRYRKI